MKIKREFLGWAGLDGSSMEETVSILEAKENAWEALNRHSSINVISSYQRNKKHGNEDLNKRNCQLYNVEFTKILLE